MAETLQDEHDLQEQSVEQPVEQGETLRPISSVPWLAVAFAGHALLVVAAWFMLPTHVAAQPQIVIQAATEQVAIPPIPLLHPPEEAKLPTLTPTESDSKDPKITMDAKQQENSDPNDKPTPSIAPNPNNPPEESAESPSLTKATNSSVGLAGGPGGGSGPGGDGGNGFSRSDGYHQSSNRTVIDGALEWLVDHQNVEGYWSGDHFADDSRRTHAKRTGNLRWTGETEASPDTGWGGTEVGLTGLATLAFLSTGCDNRTGDYREQIRRSLVYLRRVQANDGCFGAKDEHNYVYQHAIATMAMCEAFQSSGDKLLKYNAERAVDYIVRMQNPGMGWRYGEKPGDNDSSVTGWMVLALKSAHMAGIDFDISKCYDGASKWLDVATADYKGYPRTGYITPASPNSRLRGCESFENNASLDAINIMTRLFMGREGWDAKNKTIQAQASVCAQDAPVWKKEKVDYYYWYYASLALFQVGGNSWNSWSKAMMSTLTANQRGYRAEDAGTSRESLDEFGSWDAVDAWSSAGGRVYATAINCLTMQVWYRYQRLADKK